MTSGFQHAIAGGQGNLIVAQLQSPNFSLSGETGWAVLQNGDAYFFNITAEGDITASEFIGNDFVINTSGAFFYSGTPATGNLIESVSNTAGTDGFGNHYVAGHATYQSGFAASLNGGFQVSYTGSLSPGWTAKVTIEIDSSGNLYLAAAGGGTLEMDQSGNVTISGALSVSGTFSAGGETGFGGPGGTVTGGPNSGTFAGHTHDFLGHYHTY